MYISWKLWPFKPKSKLSVVSHSTISQFYLTNLPPYGINRIYMFSNPLLHEGCINGSTVYLDFNLFNPHTCNNCSGTLQKGSVKIGYWDHQLWILVCTAKLNNSCIIVAYLSLFVILAWMVKRYKMRKRENLLPNEHFFAERYYILLLNIMRSTIALASLDTVNTYWKGPLPW